MNRSKPNYRANVCAALTDATCSRVLLFRVVKEQQRWQFPQGGLLAGESAEAGIRRELQEEIGVNKVEILQKLPNILCYLYPPEIKERLKKAATIKETATKETAIKETATKEVTEKEAAIKEATEKACYDGQAQTWFLVRLLNNEEDILLDTHHTPEFDSWRWVTPREAIAEVVSFKREVYRVALTAFFGL